jgi:mRNA-degrading endonuclease RelE of RelBE toxin-antitoxin system
MNISAAYSKKAQKFLKRCEAKLAQRILDKVDELCKNPFPADSKRVENRFVEDEKVFRIRIGDHRLMYCIKYNKKRLLVIKIDKRDRAYN